MRFQEKEFDVSTPVFVLGLFDTGLMTAKALAELGITVLGFDCDPKKAGFYSKSFSAYLCPSPTQDPDNLVKYLIKKRQLYSKCPILVATSDLFLAFISQHESKIRSHFNLGSTGQHSISEFLDKSVQNQLATLSGLRVPASVSCTLVKKNEAILETLVFPVFVKPVETTQWQNHFKKKGIRVTNILDLKNLLIHLETIQIKVLIQEIIPGPIDQHFEVSIYVDQNSTLSAFFVMKKLRQFPVEFGVGTFGISVENSALKELAKKWVESTQFRGIGNLEFKWDYRDKSFKFIEINLRVWQQIELARLCGVDFSKYMYADLTGQSLPGPQSYLIGKRWIDPLKDWFSFVKSDTSSPPSLKRWLREISQSQVLGIYQKNDILPFISSLRGGVLLILFIRDWSYGWIHFFKFRLKLRETRCSDV